MLIFKKLDLKDIELIKSYFSLSKTRTCDNTVGGTFIWRDFFCMEYAPYKDNFIFKGKFLDNSTVFAMPLGKNTDDITDSLKQIEFYCIENSIPMTICLATEEDIEIIKIIYKNINVFPETEWSDYVYNASDLAELAGRKYSGQRNHINYFKRTFLDYEVKQINFENIEDVRKFFIKYNDAHSKSSLALIEETKKVFEIFDNYGIYGQTGIALYVDGVVIGFAIGEAITDTLFVHIEKADSEYRGAYQMIVNEFSKQNANGNIIYINREDDAGDEHLRISKMSYHPCEIIKKYTVIINI